jgi:NMD protein affecting ribosome stability and mRNA decay
MQLQIRCGRGSHAGMLHSLLCHRFTPATCMQAVKITDIHEGVDFFFQSRAHALKLVDFLQVRF